jgi:hypothetical protein
LNPAIAFFNPIGAAVTGFQQGQKWAWEEEKQRLALEDAERRARIEEQQLTARQALLPVEIESSQLKLDAARAANLFADRTQPLREQQLDLSVQAARQILDQKQLEAPFRIETQQDNARLRQLAIEASERQAQQSRAVQALEALRGEFGEAGVDMALKNSNDPALMAAARTYRDRRGLINAENYIRVGDAESAKRALSQVVPDVDFSYINSLDKNSQIRALANGVSKLLAEETSRADSQFRSAMPYVIGDRGQPKPDDRMNPAQTAAIDFLRSGVSSGQITPQAAIAEFSKLLSGAPSAPTQYISPGAAAGIAPQPSIPRSTELPLQQPAPVAPSVQGTNSVNVSVLEIAKAQRALRDSGIEPTPDAVNEFIRRARSGLGVR